MGKIDHREIIPIGVIRLLAAIIQKPGTLINDKLN